MFWAAFGHNCRTDLVSMNGDPESARGGVTAAVYLGVLKEHLETILEPNDIFMQDNASIHKAHIILEWFQEMGITLMDWPPYSPNLNPIENLWALLKAAIWEKYPDLEFCIKTDANLRRLIQAAQDVWSELKDELLCKLSDTMPKRVQAVLDAEGWYTKY